MQSIFEEVNEQDRRPQLLQSEPAAPVDSTTFDMDEVIGRVTRDTQVRLIKISGETYRLVPKIPAVTMAKLSKGANDGDFHTILQAITEMVHKDSRAKFTSWLEDEEVDVDTLMEFMQRAMEIISGKG